MPSKKSWRRISFKKHGFENAFPSQVDNHFPKELKMLRRILMTNFKEGEEIFGRSLKAAFQMLVGSFSIALHFL